MNSDASKSGFGGTFKNNWIQGTYPPLWQEQHISLLEFYPVLILIEMFGPEIQNSTIIFYCDNEAVCFIINNMTTKDPLILHFLRKLVLTLIKNNIDLRAKHIPGKKNILSDRISRFQVTQELLRNHHMSDYKTPVPANLQPTNYLLGNIMTS